MRISHVEKYLAEITNKDGKQYATIVEQISKGYGIVAHILAFPSDIPLGHRKLQIGLELRKT